MKQMKRRSSFHTMKCSVKTGFTFWFLLSSYARCEDEDIEDEFGGVNIKVFRGPSRIIGNQTFAPFGYHVKMPSAHSSKNYEKKEDNDDNDDKVNLKDFDFSSDEKGSQEAFDSSNEEKEDEPFEFVSKEQDEDDKPYASSKKQNLNDVEFDLPSKEEQEEPFDISAENKYSGSFENSDESRENLPLRRSWEGYVPSHILYRRRNIF